MLTRISNRLHHARLRRAAICYAEHHWAVVPGAVRYPDRFRCAAGCPATTCHPDSLDWERTATSDPDRVAALWTQRPHAVLLATGRTFDVLEVPAFLGMGAERSAVRGPVAVTCTGRWMFLVRPGAVLLPELAARTDVVLHGPGSWIPAPPTRTLIGRIRWLVGPKKVGWGLPDLPTVQTRLVQSLPSPPRRPTLVPRPA
jgi:hypothetical protein